MAIGKTMIASQTSAVFDTSIWINLFATEQAGAIISAIGFDIALPPQVLRELRRDPVTNQPFNRASHPALALPLVRQSALAGAEVGLFLELVAAAPPDGLGDGEAAAIAIAVQRSSVLAIDERKARRILAERFPHVTVVRSAEILNMPAVFDAIGEAAAKECIAKAIRFGRMHTA